MAKAAPSSTAPPKTPKTAEPAAAIPPPSSSTGSDEASPHATNDIDAGDACTAGGPLTDAQLRAFVEMEAAPAHERLALLSSALRVAHYESNPRALVWVDFCFGVLTFALNDARLSEPKTLALLHVANEVFGFATSPSYEEETPVDSTLTINDDVHELSPQQQEHQRCGQPGAARMPSQEATYEVFRQLVRANSVASTVAGRSSAARWDAADVAQIVAFMSSTFFRHVGAYQHVFQFPRESLAREVALVVESPLPPPPLAAATSMTS